MNRRQKRQINRELAAIVSLKNSEIDTSDIPEITDWSQAVVGSVYSSGKTDASFFASSGPRSARLPPPDPDTQQFTRIALSETTVHARSLTGGALAAATSEQIIVQCVQGEAEAWQEFIRRFQKLIASVVVRAASLWGDTSPELIEELIQEVYLRLCANNSQLLKRFDPRNENAFAGYLKALAVNVVHDYFRPEYSSKRGAGSTSDERNLTLADLESIDPTATAENDAFMEEIDRALKAIASDQERTVFWLYYRHGLSAKAIAAIPTVGLTVKGVESMIFRLTRSLKRKLTQAPLAHKAQQEPLAPPLTDLREHPIDRALRRTRSTPKKKHD